MWILAHDRVMTNWSRWRRRIAQTAGCDRCSFEREDGAHAIRDCKESKEVWPAFIPPHLHTRFFSLELKPWLLKNLCSKNES